MPRNKLALFCQNLVTRPLVPICVIAILHVTILFLVVPMLGNTLSLQYGTGFRDLYDQIAVNLIHGNGYRADAGMSRTIMREPGYPFFLAVVFGIGGYHIEAARVANLLLAFASALLLMTLCRRITGDRAVALVTSLLFLLYPGTIISEARGGVEIAFVFVVLIFMLALHKAVENQRITSFLLAGALLGAVVMVRSTPLLFPLFLAVGLVICANGLRERLRTVFQVFVLGVSMLLVMSPWIIRNYLLVGQFIPTATVGGVAAQEGQYACEVLSPEMNFMMVERAAGHRRSQLAEELGLKFDGTYYQSFYNVNDEVMFNNVLLQSAMDNYRSHPIMAAQCVGKNLLNFWFLGKTWQATALNLVVQIPILALAATGIVLLWKRGDFRRVTIVLAFIGSVLAVHGLVVAHARHSIPIIPFVMIFASIALVSIWRRVWERIGRPEMAGIFADSRDVQSLPV